MHDGLDLHVVVETIVAEADVAHLAAADVHEEMFANAGLTDEDPRRVVADGVVGEQLRDIRPHSLVDVVPVGALELLDRADVLGGRNVGFQLVEASGRVRREPGCRSSMCMRARRDGRICCAQNRNSGREARDPRSISHEFPLADAFDQMTGRLTP